MPKACQYRQKVLENLNFVKNPRSNHNIGIDSEKYMSNYGTQHV